MWKLVPVILLAMLAGCQTMTPEERRAADRQTCRDYGFRHNNDALAECLQRLDLDRRQARRYNQSVMTNWDRDLRYRRHRYYW